MELADVALLLVYAAVVGYFLRRFFLKRKMPSLFIALLPMGWVLLALQSQTIAPLMSSMKWIGVLLGALLMASVLHTDRTEIR